MKLELALAVTAAAGALILSARRGTASVIEPSEGDVLGGFSVTAIGDTVETFYNRLSEVRADVSATTASNNVAAFLYALRMSEGTETSGDAYRVCYGYSHTIESFADHPCITDEWGGKILPDQTCENAGYSPGCISTAAGAYQLIKPTWIAARDRLGLVDFSPASQDAAAVYLIDSKGALEDVKGGHFDDAFVKVRQVWASLPGNYAKQGQHTPELLAQWIQNAGGVYA
jgi:muramidase (phage lysozyme)